MSVSGRRSLEFVKVWSCGVEIFAWWVYHFYIFKYVLYICNILKDEQTTLARKQYAKDILLYYYLQSVSRWVSLLDSETWCKTFDQAKGKSLKNKAWYFNKYIDGISKYASFALFVFEILFIVLRLGGEKIMTFSCRETSITGGSSY